MLGCAAVPSPAAVPPATVPAAPLADGAQAVVPEPTAAPPGAPAPATGATEPGDQTSSVRPGVNDKYYARGAVEKWTEVFEAESREVAANRAAIVAALALREGTTVADIGAGTGLFTFTLAEVVGASGRVDAVDIVPGFLERLRGLKAKYGVEQVRVIEGGERETRLPDGSVQLAFLCNVYHHLEYPVAYMRSVRRALSPGGEVVVIDFERIEGVTSKRMLKHVRAPKETVLAELVEAGFELVAEQPLLKDNYFLRLRPAP